LQVSKIGSLEHSFDLLFEFSWFIALAWFIFRSTQNPTPLILSLLIILFISFYKHVYDQFSKVMGRSLDDAGNFERIFRRVAGRRNLYKYSNLCQYFIRCASALYSLFYSILGLQQLYILSVP
jgi:hypothetical protein